MNRPQPHHRRWKHFLAALSLAVSAYVPLSAQQTPTPAPVQSAAVFRLDLDAAVQHALTHHPTLRAARAGQGASVASKQASESALAVFSGPQIKYRRLQADLGVQIADANMNQVELERVNAVTRSYLGVLYAREQLQIAEKTVSQLTVVRDAAKTSADISKLDVERLDAFVELGRTKIEEARMGIDRAKAALREAIGLPCQTPIEIGNEPLKKFYDDYSRFKQSRGADLSVRHAVESAVNYRAEIRQATLASQVHCLEIDAQGVTLHSYARTFAAMSDIHGKILPASIIDGDYRPGPVGPEMPVFLAGSVSDRVLRAQQFYDRSLAVVDAARNLIALEVEEACARLLGNAEQIQLLESASMKITKVYESAERLYRADPSQANLNQLLQIQLLEAQTRAQLNDGYYKFGQALASLQRATVGHIWDSFVVK